MSTLSKIIGAGVNNDCTLSRELALIYANMKPWIMTYSNDALLANEFQVFVLNGTLCIALAICLEVA